MQKRYVLVLTAVNRIGILAAVATALSELGAAIVEVSQTLVQGFFTIILSADFPEGRDPEVIVAHLEGVCRPFGVTVMLRDPQSDAVSSRNEQGERYFLTLTGRDAPGVLAKISGRLARDQIDIIELYGLRRAEDGTFAIVFELDVPRGIDAADVCGGIEELGGSIGLRALLEHASQFGESNELRPVRIAWRAALSSPRTNGPSGGV
jgi:glycine cleavage system transcriptional repressor